MTSSNGDPLLNATLSGAVLFFPRTQAMPTVPIDRFVVPRRAQREEANFNRWDRITFCSEEPLWGEDDHIHGTYEYPVLVRRGQQLALTLAPTKRILRAYRAHVLAKTVPPPLNARIDLERLVDSLVFGREPPDVSAFDDVQVLDRHKASASSTASPDSHERSTEFAPDQAPKVVNEARRQYEATYVFAKFHGDGVNLEKLAFYGEDMSGSTFFKDHRDRLECLTCGVKPFGSGSELARLNSDGSCSVFFSSSNARALDALVKFLRRLRLFRVKSPYGASLYPNP